MVMEMFFTVVMRYVLFMMERDRSLPLRIIQYFLMNRHVEDLQAQIQETY